MMSSTSADSRSAQDVQQRASTPVPDRGGAGDSASVGTTEPSTDLKALMATMKAMDVESGKMVDNLCEMNIDLAEKLFGVATLVDPDAVSLMYNDVLNNPDCRKYEDMSMEEVDRIFEDLCNSFGGMAPLGNFGNEG